MNTFSSRTAKATKTIVGIFATLLISPVAASAQLKVLMSGGFSGAYQQLLPEFERTTGRVRRRAQGRKRSAHSSPGACLPTW